MMRISLSALLLTMITGLLPAQAGFKVVGYLPYYRFSYASQIEFGRLTHLNIAFANPDMAGNLDVGGQDIMPIVQMAKAEGLVVMVALAGGALTTEWKAAWEHLMLPANRSAFISKIIRYVKDHGMDGVDVDLEWSHVNDKYSPFVLELGDSTAAHGLLMTAALPGTYRYPDVTDQALQAFDWINMMSYNLTGPWAPNNPGPHSPYSFAVSSINYWRNQGVPGEKLTLGVPFYGYNFGTTPVSSFTYRTIVDQNPGNAYLDQAGMSYYNGIPTIQSKTALAMDQLGGIMIWEIGQDHYSDLSLLKAIDEVVHPVTGSYSPTLAQALSAYPNPFTSQLTVESQSGAPLEVILTDLNGRALQYLQVAAYAREELNTGSLPPGFYVLRVLGHLSQQMFRVVKH